MRVLVCNEEFAVLEILAMVFENRGYEVVQAGDATQARNLLATEPCDVIVWLVDAEPPDGAIVLKRPFRLADLFHRVREAGSSRRSA